MKMRLTKNVQSLILLLIGGILLIFVSNSDVLAPQFKNVAIIVLILGLLYYAIDKVNWKGIFNF